MNTGLNIFISLSVLLFKVMKMYLNSKYKPSLPSKVVKEESIRVQVTETSVSWIFMSSAHQMRVIKYQTIRNSVGCFLWYRYVHKESNTKYTFSAVKEHRYEKSAREVYEFAPASITQLFELCTSCTGCICRYGLQSYFNVNHIFE
jgi:hypothetical protein